MHDSTRRSDINRHDFVKLMTAFLGTIMGLFISIPGIGYLISPGAKTRETEAWIPLGLLDDYPIGTPIPFSFTRTKQIGWEKSALSYGVFVLRKDTSQVKVFSNICTHLGCHVRWHPDIQEYVSPCHDGHFDIDGNVTKGPPPRPLDQFETKVEDGKLAIRLVA